VAVLATTAIQLMSSSETRQAMRERFSTDVDNLRRKPLVVLPASAFWLPDKTSVVTLPLTLAALAASERQLGTRRFVTTFALGHTVATLLSELPVALAVSAGRLPRSHAKRVDIGMSYGAVAVLGSMAGAPGQRRIWGDALATLVLAPLTLRRDVTNAGHALAATVGFLVGRRSATPTSRSNLQESGSP
jgi:hypothetical protein